MNPQITNRRALLVRISAAFSAVAAIATSAAAGAANDKSPGQTAKPRAHRVAIHVDENDAQKMNLVLNNAVNVSQHYASAGEEVEIEVVAYGPGLHMLRTDTSPEAVQSRLKSFAKTMPNVSFAACENTRINMARAEGKQSKDDIPLLPTAKSVPSGVVRLIELQEAGWSYVRP